MLASIDINADLLADPDSRFLQWPPKSLTTCVDLLPTETPGVMVVHQAHCLHERVTRGRANKFPAKVSKLFAHVGRFVRDRPFGVKLPLSSRFKLPEEGGQ